MQYTANVSGKWVSKGHPPAGWKLPVWVYRMLVWSKKGSFSHFEHGELKISTLPIFTLPTPAGPLAVHLDGKEGGLTTFGVDFQGIPIFYEDVPSFAFEKKFKAEVSGQRVEGLLQVSVS